MRPFVHSAFVDEDERAPLAEGFFLIRGQVTLCHCRIACSSRSSALPLGRWQLQLSLRRMRQTWSSWYRTPVRYSMTARTRLARSEEHTSELQSHLNLVCRLLL